MTKRLFTPPLFLLSRLILPLGFPLVTLGYTGEADINVLARHLVFFGTCGVAMGFALEQSQSRHDARSAAHQRAIVTKQLTLLIASGGIPDELKPALSQMIEDLENAKFIQ